MADPSGRAQVSFGFEVVSEDAQSVEVRGTGERCAPIMSKAFGPTALAGDASTASTSFSRKGTIVEGDVVSADLGAEPSPLATLRLVEIDGEWYETFPGS